MEQKDENKKEKKSQLLIAAIIFIAALGFVFNFGGDKLNNIYIITKNTLKPLMI